MAINPALLVALKRGLQFHDRNSAGWNADADDASSRLILHLDILFTYQSTAVVDCL